MVATPVVEIGRSVLGVHAHVGKVAHGLSIKKSAQGVLYLVAVEIRLHVEEQTGLHGHAASVEPMFIEIIQRVAVLVGEIQIVFVVFENPFGLLRSRVQRPRDEQVQSSLQRLANPAKTAPAPMNVGGDLRDCRPVSEPHDG